MVLHSCVHEVQTPQTVADLINRKTTLPVGTTRDWMEQLDHKYRKVDMRHWLERNAHARWKTITWPILSHRWKLACAIAWEQWYLSLCPYLLIISSWPILFLLCYIPGRQEWRISAQTQWLGGKQYSYLNESVCKFEVDNKTKPQTAEDRDKGKNMMTGGNRLPFIFHLSSWQAVKWSQMKLKVYTQVVLTNLFDNSYN